MISLLQSWQHFFPFNGRTDTETKLICLDSPNRELCKDNTNMQTENNTVAIKVYPKAHIITAHMSITKYYSFTVSVTWAGELVNYSVK